MKVLVTEDEPLIQNIHSEFLELLGREADVAGDARVCRASLSRLTSGVPRRRGCASFPSRSPSPEYKATLAEVAEHAGATR
jgi:hypothetical protein